MLSKKLNQQRFWKRKLVPTIVSILFFGLVFTCPQKAILAGDIVVIVHPKSKISSIDVPLAKRIFLGKKKKVKGVKLKVYDVKKSKTKKKFYKAIAGYSLSKLRKYWAKRIFTGKGNPPKKLKNSSAVKKAVSKNKKAIGFIEKSKVDSKVKVILEI